MATSPALDALAQTQDLYARYVAIAEITDLAAVADLNRTTEEPDFSPAPLGFVFTG